MATLSSYLTASVSGQRLLTTTTRKRRNFFYSFPTRRPYSSTLSFFPNSSFKHFSESRRVSSFQIRASSEESSDVSEVLEDLKEKWDAIEDKSTVLLYGGGAVVGVWLASVVVGAINSIPLVPRFMEVVGLGYTGWFIYRYLLFKSNRKELAEDIESLKKKITGSE